VSCILTSRAEKVKTLCSAEVQLAKESKSVCGFCSAGRREGQNNRILTSDR
jgi:hypothetical protein